MVKATYKAYPPEEHGLKLADIDSDALKIIHRLHQHNHEAYIVGGGVRDLLLKKSPKDFDIATDATPQQIRRIFQNCRIIGKRFKLAHIYFRGGKIIEVATFRQSKEFDEDSTDTLELATDDCYGNISTDALRRDLTINALFFDPSDGMIHDYVGGLEDFKNRIIKIIGKPELRFQEDPVRIIRAIRHVARTGFKLDQKTADALQKTAPLLSNCPGSRIFEEFKKDLLSGYFQEILGLLNHYKILPIFLPDLAERINQDGALLKDLNFCIKGIDRHSLENKSPSLNIALTIIALFSRNEFQLSSKLPEIFLAPQDILDFYRSNYPSLQVPKKIKRDCADLTRYLWTLDNCILKNKNFKLKVDELKDDLKIILKILNINQTRSELNKLFKFV